MRIRQVALVAKELAPTRDVLFKLLGVEDDFSDPIVNQFGLRNSVIPIGDTFLEVVSPVEDGTTAGRLIERRGGDGGYMILLQVDDISREVSRVKELGVRVVGELEIPEAKAAHLHPKDIGGAITSFDEVTPAESWIWGGPDWEQRGSKHCTEITAVEIQSGDPVAMAKRWSQVLDVEFISGESQPRIILDKSEIRFVSDMNGRGDGISAVEIKTPNIKTVITIADKLELPRIDNRIKVRGTEVILI